MRRGGFVCWEPRWCGIDPVLCVVAIVNVGMPVVLYDLGGCVVLICEAKFMYEWSVVVEAVGVVG